MRGREHARRFNWCEALFSGIGLANCQNFGGHHTYMVYHVAIDFFDTEDTVVAKGGVGIFIIFRIDFNSESDTLPPIRLILSHARLVRRMVSIFRVFFFGIPDAVTANHRLH